VISISIVSHGQARIVDPLLLDLARIADESAIEIILTNNIPQGRGFRNIPGNCKVTVVDNDVRQGFGHNHNAAFTRAIGDYFCVMNPDIRLPTNPFPALLDTLHGTGATLVAPETISPSGEVEDSIRRFPTVSGLIRRVVGGDDGRLPMAAGCEPITIDWAAGMFLLFPSDRYRLLGGFDQRYFLYCEDADIGARAWKSGGKVVLCRTASVIHDAQRASHRNLRYLRWHVASYLRYFTTHLFNPPARARAKVERAAAPQG
jgi:N-acetylglucosaminyl-diphospho-decaprenol L-rhamnosyltransferase